VAQNDGRTGRPGVNDRFGEIDLSVEPDADFTLATLEGNLISISDYRGKIVVVDFWSSWCTPCRTEAEILAETHKFWQNRGVEFIGVAIWDTEQSVRNFIDLYGIEYVNAIDTTGLTAVDFGVTGIPEKFFVDHRGNIIRKVVGPNTRKTLDDILTDLTDEALENTGPS
jgi:cytochrome c biogenesis protein CcmG/thiol:disulfide interchange protein DsbE